MNAAPTEKKTRQFMTRYAKFTRPSSFSLQIPEKSSCIFFGTKQISDGLETSRAPTLDSPQEHRAPRKPTNGRIQGVLKVRGVVIGGDGGGEGTPIWCPFGFHGDHDHARGCRSSEFPASLPHDFAANHRIEQPSVDEPVCARLGRCPLGLL